MAVQGVGVLPIGKNFALFAKAGNWTIVAFGATDDATDPAYRVGGQFRFGQRKGAEAKSPQLAGA